MPLFYFFLMNVVLLLECSIWWCRPGPFFIQCLILGLQIWKSLACSHKYAFFVHLSEDKSDCPTLILSHYSLCFVFAKCQNTAVSLLKGYIMLSALEKNIGNWYNSLEKRKKFGRCWGKKEKKRKEKSNLASYSWQILSNQQPIRVSMALLSTNL